MYDHQTRSLWSHITGEAVRGPLKGKRLTPLAAMPQISWETWRQNYPKTRVLSVPLRGGTVENMPRDMYADYHASPRAGVSGMKYTDNRLPNKSLVIGVQVQAEDKRTHYRAYPLSDFAETAVINDSLGGVPLLIFHDRTSFATAVFKQDGLTFQHEEGHFATDETGTRWNLVTGEALSGEQRGARLERLPAVNIYWFAWARYYPETTIYRD